MRVQYSQALVFISGLIAAPILATTSGCSLFPFRSENASNRLPSTNITSDSNPIAVPVDIAQDIAKIHAGWEPQQVPAQAGDMPAPVYACQPTAVRGGHAMTCLPEQLAQRVPSSAKGGGQGKSELYKVHAGDTLMKISFAKYGDVYRWREIYNRNREKIQDFNALVAGTSLVIDGVEFLVIERNGQPYLIRKADTLVKISRSLYGTPEHWSDLWHNNPHLIHNPNKIYAGFTLYYRPELRQPSSEPTAPNAPKTHK